MSDRLRALAESTPQAARAGVSGPVDPTSVAGSGSPAELTVIRGGGEGSPLPTPPATPDSWDSDLLSYSETQGQLDDLYRRGFLAFDLYEKATTRWLILNGLPVEMCESCRKRRAAINDRGYRICGSCVSGGRS